MAIDLTAPTESPIVRNFTASTNATKITVAGGVWKVSIYPIGAAAKLGAGSLGLADGDAFGASAYATLPADAWSEILLTPLSTDIDGSRSIYVAAGSSISVQLIAELVSS
jgi:hypothetical protein